MTTSPHPLNASYHIRQKNQSKTTKSRRHWADDEECKLWNFRTDFARFFYPSSSWQIINFSFEQQHFTPMSAPMFCCICAVSLILVNLQCSLLHFQFSMMSSIFHFSLYRTFINWWSQFGEQEVWVCKFDILKCLHIILHSFPFLLCNVSWQNRGWWLWHWYYDMWWI